MSIKFSFDDGYSIFCYLTISLPSHVDILEKSYTGVDVYELSLLESPFVMLMSET